MITKKDVEHIARLARIELTEAEEQKFEKELSSILGFVAKLSEVDTSGIEPMAGGRVERAPPELKEATREDETVKPLGNPAELVNAAPQKKEGWVEVKAVFD